MAPADVVGKTGRRRCPSSCLCEGGGGGREEERMRECTGLPRTQTIVDIAAACCGHGVLALPTPLALCGGGVGVACRAPQTFRRRSWGAWAAAFFSPPCGQQKGPREDPKRGPRGYRTLRQHERGTATTKSTKRAWEGGQ